MLTPQEIKDVVFSQSVVGGYKREEVDDFLDKVLDDYTKIYNDNAELIEKIKVCVEKIEEYRNDEKFLKTAILNAQKLNETGMKELEIKEKEIVLAAKQKATEIIDDAKSQADKLTSDAKSIYDEALNGFDDKVESEKHKLEALKKEVSDFKKKILDLYKEHINIITKLPEVKEKKENIEKKPPAVEKEPQKQEVVKAKTETKEKSLADSTDEKTAEFSIKQKETKPEEKTKDNPRFKDLKFGVDFDINSDK